jgi:A/G-specific adenine glycosylase
MLLDDSHLRDDRNWVGVLLNWYDLNKRDFPWRREKTTYGTWICEVMSQQTTMAVVVPRYVEFLKALPSVSDLASCSDETLRELWSGLGYYARARNLRRGAEYIVQNRAGVFPDSYEDWLHVSGVGPYTASVISSICFSRAKGCVDGNVIRVVARMTGCSSPEIWSETGKAKIQDLVDECISTERPGDFNQAMMELGATVCQKLSPACGSCPVKDFCRAFRNDSVRACPVPKPRKSFESVELDALSVQISNCEQVPGEAVLLVGRASGFLSQTMGFPLFGQGERDALMRWLGEKSFVKSSRVLEKIVSHTITNHQIQVRVVDVTLKQQSGVADDFIAQFKDQFPHLIASSRWVSKSITGRTVASSLDRKIWENISRF